MRTRDIIICLITFALGITLLVVAGNQLDYINSQRKEMKLVINEPLENAPPSLAFATVAMGAFRGLIVDILWIRADRLKEEGQFFDARQLAEWIVTLQPRFSAVWAFQAWNMAYNISVAIPASQPEQRWQWIKNGFELLRDKGIPLNPGDISLYRELALIFQHKMGGVTDDAHRYYKLQLAKAMAPLLGPANEQYFQELAETPETLSEIISDANVLEFVNALKSADENFADNETFISNYLALRQKPAKFKTQAFDVIDRYRQTTTLEKFDIFAKANQLRNVWKLEPKIMQEINKQFGPVEFTDPNHHLPMDWRHPDTHAIYWAVKGFKQASKEDISVSMANADRIINHSLQNLYRYGKMYIYTLPQEQRFTETARPDRNPQLTQAVYLKPDLRMFSVYDKHQLYIIEKYKDDNSLYDSMRSAHRNFLRNSTLNFYLAGHNRYARKIYRELQTVYPDKEFEVDFTVYVRNRLKEEVGQLGITDAREMVMLIFREAYFYYAMHEDNEAYNREQIATEVHKYYLKLFEDEEHRVDLPPLDRIRYMALIDFLSDSLFPPSLRQRLATRIQIERPDLSKQLEDERKKILEELEKQQQTKQP